MYSTFQRIKRYFRQSTDGIVCVLAYGRCNLGRGAFDEADAIVQKAFANKFGQELINYHIQTSALVLV